ncbi:MAG: rhomboid family intramembrane serine protease [Saprospiraceae bacterium]|nr:MAG: rhomboid family intramembrane serine protease [Saprospiraceae bacterium]
MFTSIWEDIKREYNYGNMVTRIIIINTAVFVLVNLTWVILRLTHAYTTPRLYNSIIHFFSLSSDWMHNLTHPWVWITSMFLHEGFMHILFNMLFMYWFGRIVGDFIGNHRILPLYLLGGLVGGLAFVLSINFLPYDATGAVHYALGASGAVMGIVVAAGVLSPDYLMHLPFIGGVKLKFIVGTLVFIDLIGLAGDTNTGGHFAHIGGAIFGWIFVWQLREGNDWSVPVSNLLDRIKYFFKSLGNWGNTRKGPRVVYKNPNRSRTPKSRKGNSASDQPIDLSHQERLDAILDKIKKSGYESLTSEEKEFLFNASKEK